MAADHRPCHDNDVCLAGSSHNVDCRDGPWKQYFRSVVDRDFVRFSNCQLVDAGFKPELRSELISQNWSLQRLAHTEKEIKAVRIDAGDPVRLLYCCRQNHFDTNGKLAKDRLSN